MFGLPRAFEADFEGGNAVGAGAGDAAGDAAGAEIGAGVTTEARLDRGNTRSVLCWFFFLVGPCITGDCRSTAFGVAAASKGMAVTPTARKGNSEFMVRDIVVSQARRER